MLPENKDAEKIYMAVHDQVIAGMGGVVAINQMAIHAVMELYDIPDKIGCFEKVVRLYRTIIEQESEE